MVRAREPVIDVNPRSIHINDIAYGIYGANSAKLVPLGYNCTLSISPRVVTALLKWAIRNGYLALDGEISYVVVSEIRKVKGNGKQEGDETESRSNSQPSTECS